MKTVFARPAIRAAAVVAIILSAGLPIPSLQAQAPAKPQAPTSGDFKEYEAALELMRQEKWKDAMVALEAFRDKYKELSPYSFPAKYSLAICYLRQKPPLFDYAASELRKLLTQPDTKVDAATKEQAQLLIAKAITMKGADMPATNDVQKGAQAKIFEQAIKEYDAFLATYPKSRGADSAHFLRASLLLGIERYVDAVKGFNTLIASYPQSTLRNPSLMNVGKSYLQEGYSLLQVRDGKEPKEEDIKRTLTIFESQALPALTDAYTKTGDLAIQNEAVYYIGQIRLTQSQYVSLPDEEAQKKKQKEYLASALEAFRAVRSREEVVEQQNAKLELLKKAIQLLTPGTPEYTPSKNYYELLTELEEEKKTKLLTEQDQFLGARLALARIFLFLKKPDECRVLIRYLQGQKEVLEKEADAQAQIAALLCLTYIETKNLPKALETYEAYRTAFKSKDAGDNLPLLISQLCVDSDQPDKAEEVVKQGMEDYKPWRFAADATRILVAVAIKKGDFERASKLIEDVLATSPKPEIEAEMLVLKGTVLRAIASEKSDPKKADEAVTTFRVVMDKFPNTAKAEDARFEIASILAGRDPAAGQTELQKYLSDFAGGGKSENTKTNLPIAQFLLGKVLDALGKQDDAIKAYRAVSEKWPESDPAPGSFFKIFDIYNVRKDYNTCVKVMEEYLQKYPAHENVYFAYNNIAEILFSGLLNAKTTPDGKPAPAAVNALADLEAGAKKLNEFVDYELEKNLKDKRGDGALIKIADRWVKELNKLPAYLTLNNEQKLIWQKAVDGIIASMEKLLKSHPQSPRLGEGLERLVTAQTAKLKAQQIDAAKGEAYFLELANKPEATRDVKAQLYFAVAAFLQSVDPKKAADYRAKAMAESPKTEPPAADPGKPGEAPSPPIAPRFTPADWDRYLTDLFDAKKFDEMTKSIERVRSEYPLSGKEQEDPSTAPPIVQEGQATAMYWEAKVLGEQGKNVEAGTIYQDLAKKYPKSTKVFEADYGVILGMVDQQKYQDDFVPRLTKVVNNVSKVKTFELPAKALFLIGRVQKDQKDYDEAIKTFQKIHTRYASVPKVAGDGLWEAAQLLEQQATGKLPVKTKKELQDAAKAAAEKSKAAKAKAEAEKAKSAPKPADVKPDDAKPDSKPKPDAAKPADPTTAKAEAGQK